MEVNIGFIMLSILLVALIIYLIIKTVIHFVELNNIKKILNHYDKILEEKLQEKD